MRPIRGWDAFFFTPADPHPLGLVRVVVGVLAFWSLFVYGLDLADFFGPDGWADAETVRAVQGVELALRLVVLVLRARRSCGRSGSPAWSSWRCSRRACSAG